MKLEKSEIQSGIWTAVSMILLLILLFFMTINMERPKFTENEIEINFGDGADGAPAPEETTEASSEQASEAVTSPATTTTVPDVTPPRAVESMVQEDNSAAIAEQKRQKEERRKALEAQRAEQARIAAEKAVAEAAAKAKAERDAKAAKASALTKGAFGGGGTSASGSGPGGGGTGKTPGNPLGRGTSNGHSWSLAGRTLTGGIPTPAYIGDQEGTIVVSITVNKSGNVIGTDIYKGTTISDQALRNECREKAKRIKFSANPSAIGNQVGQITYRFKKRE